jgi:DNA-binding MarR family transcriptional regulator
MSDRLLSEEAEAIASLMPKLARGLFPPDHDPAADLPLAQLRVCGILNEGPKPMSTLGRELGVSLSAMTQIADRLERAALVRRVAEGSDRRVRCLQLTPQGESMMRRRQEARVRRILAVLAHVAPESRAEIRAALETLHRACLASQQPKAAPGIELPAQPELSSSVSKASS